VQKEKMLSTELYHAENIHSRLFSLNYAEIEKCLTTAMEIRGLGIAGASGLLSVLFPQAFGSVNEYLVTLLRGIEGINYDYELSQMNPALLTAKNGVILTKILREKANELNRRFETDFWMPRKIDKVLWACGR